ncbi:hypothetical protein NDU88_005792 [Pleurodeles waltl]|uniref:Uncharacterized protein n=1 Tax=Pleurodeles waltl TaxID=8319 RepID=A0AAV7QI59_PLEWA|nr:hypothetical protein NDU88_005792 [Pleurodeles waltl]
MRLGARCISSATEHAAPLFSGLTSHDAPDWASGLASSGAVWSETDHRTLTRKGGFGIPGEAGGDIVKWSIGVFQFVYLRLQFACSHRVGVFLIYRAEREARNRTLADKGGLYPTLSTRTGCVITSVNQRKARPQARAPAAGSATYGEIVSQLLRQESK